MEILGGICLLLLAVVGFLLRAVGRASGTAEERSRQAAGRARLEAEAETADRKAKDRATAALHSHTLNVATIHRGRGSDLGKPMSQEDADRLVREARTFRGED